MRMTGIICAIFVLIIRTQANANMRCCRKNIPKESVRRAKMEMSTYIQFGQMRSNIWFILHLLENRLSVPGEKAQRSFLHAFTALYVWPQVSLSTL